MKKKWILVVFYSDNGGCYMPNSGQIFENKETALVEFGKAEIGYAGLAVCEIVYPKPEGD